MWLAGCFLGVTVNVPFALWLFCQTAKTNLKGSDTTGRHPAYVSSSCHLNFPFVSFWYPVFLGCSITWFKWTGKCNKKKKRNMPRGLLMDVKLESVAYRGSRRHQVPHVCLFWLHRYLYSPCCLVYSLLYASFFSKIKFHLNRSTALTKKWLNSHSCP